MVDMIKAPPIRPLKDLHGALIGQKVYVTTKFSGVACHVNNNNLKFYNCNGEELDLAVENDLTKLAMRVLHELSATTLEVTTRFKANNVAFFFNDNLELVDVLNNNAYVSQKFIRDVFGKVFKVAEADLIEFTGQKLNAGSVIKPQSQILIDGLPAYAMID